MKRIKTRFFLGSIIFFAGIGVLRACNEAKINKEKELEKYKIEIEPIDIDEVIKPVESLPEIDWENEVVNYKTK